MQMLDRLSDCMMFGAPKPCPECGSGQLVFQSGGGGYHCRGNISEWTKCQHKTATPERKEFKVPKDFKDRFDFCKLYKCKVKDRIIPNNPSTVASSQSSMEASQPSTSKGAAAPTKSGQSLPLKNLTFVIEGKLANKADVKKDVEKLGGTVGKKVGPDTAAVISDEGT